jgi:hypothetical protein
MHSTPGNAARIGNRGFAAEAEEAYTLRQEPSIQAAR